MNKGNKMPHDVYKKLFLIKLNSKTGAKLEKHEFEFCVECWKKYPDEYASIEKEVIEEANRKVNPLYKM